MPRPGAEPATTNCEEAMGPSCAGCHNGKDADIVTVFEAVGRHAAGAIGDAELQRIEEVSIPGEGACGGRLGRGARARSSCRRAARESARENKRQAAQA